MSNEKDGQDDNNNATNVNNSSGMSELLGNTSMTELVDDSGEWINKVDVTRFAELTRMPLGPGPHATPTFAHRPTAVQRLCDGSLIFASGGSRNSSGQYSSPEIPVNYAGMVSDESITCEIPSPSGTDYKLSPPEGAAPDSRSASHLAMLLQSSTPISSGGRPPPGLTQQVESSPPSKRGRPTLSCDGLESGRLSPIDMKSGSCGVGLSGYPKPIYSYSCLIALALKNSRNGKLQVSEIYNFMCENFPYFRSAPAGWKNSVRHNLSLNKCFQKIEIESPAGHGRKACLWMLNPARANKMEQEILKWRQKDPTGVKDSLANPQDLEQIEKGLKGMPPDNSSTSQFAPGTSTLAPNPNLPRVASYGTLPDLIPPQAMWRPGVGVSPGQPGLPPGYSPSKMPWMTGGALPPPAYHMTPNMRPSPCGYATQFPSHGGVPSQGLSPNCGAQPPPLHAFPMQQHTPPYSPQKLTPRTSSPHEDPGMDWSAGSGSLQLLVPKSEYCSVGSDLIQPYHGYAAPGPIHGGPRGLLVPMGQAQVTDSGLGPAIAAAMSTPEKTIHSTYFSASAPATTVKIE